jgi:MFS transporter, DHA1 family, tetracycline resistance protein
MQATPTHAPRQAAVAFVMVTVMLDVLSIGIIIPVLPALVEGFVGGNTSKAATILGVFGTAWAVAQFFCSPILGSLSDRFGRRPVIILSNLGLGLDYVLMALAPNLSWLFAGRVISGVTSASLGVAGAYIADVTPPEQRASKFGLIGMAFGFGFILGPAFGGLLGGIDTRLPFWVAAGLSLTNTLYGTLVLPESLPREKRTAFSWRRANPVGSLRLLRSTPQLFKLASVGFLTQLAHVVLPSVCVLYMTYRFGWSIQTVGLVLCVSGVFTAIVQGGLVGRVVRKVGEHRALLLGLSFGAIGFAIYGLATTSWQFLLGLPFLSLWGLAMPSAQALMSRHVSATQQGQLQGANSSVMGLAALLGPGLFSQVFAYAIAPQHQHYEFPGAPFVLAAALLVMGAVLASGVTRMSAVATQTSGS